MVSHSKWTLYEKEKRKVSCYGWHGIMFVLLIILVGYQLNLYEHMGGCQIVGLPSFVWGSTTLDGNGSILYWEDKIKFREHDSLN